MWRVLERIHANIIMVSTPNGERPLGRRMRLCDSIKMDLKWHGKEWVGFIWLRSLTSHKSVIKC